MKTIGIALGLLAANLSLLAQSVETTEEPLRPLFKIELGGAGLGLAYELPLADRWSIDVSTGLGGGHRIEDDFSGRTFQYTWVINDPVIYLKSEVKYHYNRPKRLRKGRSLRNNASNYVAFQTKYTTQRVFGSTVYDQLREPLNNTLLNEIHWGLQRPLGQRFLFNFHLGLGYAFDYDFNNGSVYPGLGLKFSYIIFR